MTSTRRRDLEYQPNEHRVQQQTLCIYKDMAASCL